MDQHVVTTDTLALKEWGAAVHALLQGRQTILLRKGGIHEKAFTTPEGDRGAFVLFPTVAHTHAERTRPEHHDLLPLGAADVDDGWVVLRTAVRLVEVVEAVRPEGLLELAEDHIWTQDSIRRDRLEFRPKHPLQVLVVETLPLAEPVRLTRLDSHGGCRSWIDVDLGRPLGSAPEGGPGPVLPRAEVEATAARVRRAVG